MLKKYDELQLAALCCGYSEAEVADYQGLNYRKIDDRFYEKYDITVDTLGDILADLRPFMQTASEPEPASEPESTPESKSEHTQKLAASLGDKKKCFRARVRTINALGDTSHTKIGIQDYEERKHGEYFACEHGTVHVLANDMVEVAETLGKGTVLSIEEVGPGYVAGQ